MFNNIIYLMCDEVLIKCPLSVLWCVYVCETEHIADVSSSACFTESCSCSTNVSQQVEIT